MSDMKIQGPIGSKGIESPQIKKTGDKSEKDFAEVLKDYIDDVNELQLNADKTIEKMVSGEIEDVHQAVLAVQEANVAFNLMMQIRNKLTEAYQEIMRMQV